MLSRLLLGVLLLASGLAAGGGEEIVVIGHAGLPKTDRATLQRLYTGRSVSIGALAVTPVNLPAGNPLRDKFLQWIMEQTEDQYTGYWLVRRYVGKGSPPMEFGDPDEVAKFVQMTPGALGYVPLSKVPMGTNVIYRH